MASTVALLAEGVDRNLSSALDEIDQRESPSSRRAWIEISPASQEMTRASVALLAEGVDRNFLKTDTCAAFLGRPPRGGRG